MKRVNFLIAAALFAVSSVFVGCSDDDDITPPSIKFDNVTNNTYTLPEGVSSYTVNATITSEENLKTVKILQKTGSESIQVGQTITSFTDKKNYNLKQEITGITQDISIIVVANNGSERQSELKIVFTSAPDPEPTTKISTFTNRKMYCSVKDGSFETTAASVDGTLIIPKTATAEQIAKCDFVYFYTNKATMYSPQSAPTSLEEIAGWTTKNDTRFAVLSNVDFAEITAGNIIEKAGNPTATTADFIKDSVVAFKTSKGKVGVFKVTDLQAGYDGTDYCIIDIKVVE
ncbi:MAG: hypothetical protein LBQ60_11925 [Bacteroidales bacterium]|jgi:hypothetical protein|nr:hypothetical protein [Bacteroidales bacterium]